MYQHIEQNNIGIRSNKPIISVNIDKVSYCKQKSHYNQSRKLNMSIIKRENTEICIH